MSKDNPFSKIVKEKEEAAESSSVSEAGEIGFPQRSERPQVRAQSRIVNEQMTGAVIQNNMIEARSGLSERKSFMGALNFLNSQAAISLIKTRGEKFEAVV